MRLFVAIHLSQSVRDHLVEVQRRMRPVAGEISWTRSENLHLTLKFLGETPEQDVAALAEALSAVKGSKRDLSRLEAVEWFGPVELRAQQVQFFPPKGPVRIVGAALGGDVERLALLHSRIEQACEQLGFAREGRAFRPHVTLGRARRRLGPAMRGRLSQAIEGLWPGPLMGVGRFVLIQSILESDAPVYQQIAGFDLPA